MTGAIGQNEVTIQAAQEGLALLRLMAEAADKDKQTDWVYRRVEQLEFLDTRAVRWRISVDFVVPETAPVTYIGGRRFRLVPLTSWEKDNLVGFDLRDECGNTIWLPNSQDTGLLLASALVYWARDIVGEPSPQLKQTLTAIVSEWPSAEQREEERKPGTEMKPFHAVRELMIAKHGEAAANDYLDAPPPRLEDDRSFWSQVNELWRNFLIVVALPDTPGTRRVLKMTFESKVEFRRPDSWRPRTLQSLGWQGWRLELYLGGRGGNHHLEVAAPPGVDIVRIRARPVIKVPDPTYVVAYGGAPHVHIRIKADQRSRYLTTIRVRVSRPGWLTMCWLAGLIIPAVLLTGALKLSVLFSGATEEGTAATLLLALLAVFVTMLVGPGAHPLASRLLLASRGLIVFDSGLVLLGVGSLLLQGHDAPKVPGWTTVLWWVLCVLSGLCAVLLTLSRLLPEGPNQVEKADRPKKKRRRKKKKKKKPAAESDKPDPFALAIPAADGYHYGDNPEHEWNDDRQTDLVRALRRAEVKVLF
jgi:hypothetical protein